MDINYTWLVESMTCYTQEGGHNDVVFTVAWRLNATYENYAATIYGSCTVPAPGDPFTPYADLTQDQVLGWIWDNGVSKDDCEASMAQAIETQMNPPVVVLPLPWAQN